MPLPVVPSATLIRQCALESTDGDSETKRRDWLVGG
jgi:hypothetical protein